MKNGTLNNKSDTYNSEKLKTYTCDLEKVYHENCNYENCYHKNLKTYTNKFNTIDLGIIRLCLCKWYYFLL